MKLESLDEKSPWSNCDVLVVGGGPAGSVSATLLAQQGLKVVLIEKETFPRYHIGESLLPSVLWFLDLLGAREKLDAVGFVKKPGSYFEWGPDTWFLNFGLNKNETQYSYQVERDCFDKLLLDHAMEQGVHVISPAKVKKLISQKGRYIAAQWSKDGEASLMTTSFKYIIDASGRAGLIAKGQLNNRSFHDVFKNVAIWGYWENIEPLKNERSGAIAIGSIDVGWVWVIPLRDGLSSVGVVLHKSEYLQQKHESIDEFYQSLLSRSSMTAAMIQPGSLVSKVRVEQDYSYAADNFCGPNYFLVGDAACFLDPLLSTGVHLAMLSAVMAAATVKSLSRGEISENEGEKFYDQSYRLAYVRLLAFVSGFYQQYRGKKSHFWEAQSLTRKDYHPEHLESAFLKLVSGVEDLSDIDQGFDEHILQEMNKRIEQNLKLRGAQLNEEPAAPLEHFEDNAAFMGSVAGLSTLLGADGVNDLTIRVQGEFGVFRK